MAPSSSTPQSLGKWTKRILSCVVAVHVWATLGPPLAFQTRGPLGSSPSVETLITPVRRYGEFLYLNRGYAFFAPDPGPSHLVQAAYSNAQGQRIEEIYPDRKQHWPRLLYHRHFMLAEFLHEIYHPPGPPPELNLAAPVEARLWTQSRSRYERVRQSYVDHLARHRDGSSNMAIRRLEHPLPTFAEFTRDALLLNDPRTYNVLLDRPIDLSVPDASVLQQHPIEVLPAEPVSSEPSPSKAEGAAK